jgi:hypothetical protein
MPTMPYIGRTPSPELNSQPAEAAAQAGDREKEKYESLLLPGFVVPLGKLLEAADRMAEAE